jgi:hypothetical protein
VFNTLLKSNNLDAKSALSEYSASQNKEQFYEKIINLCRNPRQTQTAAIPVAPPKAAVTSPPAAPATVAAPKAATTNGISQNRKENKKACYLFREGKCSRGNECKFEHTFGQSQEITAPRRSNQEVSQEKKEAKPVCHFFQTGGICRKADRCRYQHPNGVKEGNNWRDHKFERKNLSEKKNEEKKNSPKITNVVDPEATEENEGGMDSIGESVPSLTADAQSNQNDETGGRSLLQDSDKETFPTNHKNSQSDLNVTLEASDETEGL